jgi:hypothetical protein
MEANNIIIVVQMVMKDQILNVQIHTRVSMRWMRMVMMKINAKASKIQATAVVDRLYKFPLQFLSGVWFRSIVVSMFSCLTTRGESFWRESHHMVGWAWLYEWSINLLCSPLRKFSLRLGPEGVGRCLEGICCFQ